MEEPNLHAAIREGTLFQIPVHQLTVQNLTAPNAAGNTPLHTAARYGRLRELPAEVLTAEHLLRKNKSGYTPLHHAAEAGHLLQIPTAMLTREILLTRSNSGYYYYGITDFGAFLPMLAKFNIPIFLTSTRNTFKERIQLMASPVTIEAALVRDGSDYSLQAGLRMNGQVFTTNKNSLQIISQEPVPG